MNKILYALTILTILISIEVMAEEVPLWLNYKLPENTDLKYEARRLEANALSQRNIEVQACANGKNSNLCENNAEVAFRRRILAIPEVRFRLFYSEMGTTAKWLLDLSAAEVTDPQLNQIYKHLGPESSEYIGISIDTSNCNLRNSTNNSLVSYYNSRFTQVICQLLISKTNATIMLCLQRRRSKL